MKSVSYTHLDTAYNALITYVIPGSPAAAVLKRGDWIVKVDTSYISKDVYKRQVPQLPATNRIQNDQSPILPLWVIIDFRRSGSYVMAVSYTHLDVHKRQVL